MIGDDEGPSPTQLGYVDGVCDQFEAAWKGKHDPRIEDYLGASRGPGRSALLLGLLALELELRRRRGERPGPQEYRSRFPDSISVVDEAFGITSSTTDQTDAGRTGHAAPDSPADLTATYLDASESLPPDSRRPSASVPGGRGPRFKILRLHAKGGLGEVFIAEDAELNREVALKEIQDRHADDPRSRARFLLEAQVTGGLEHPGIVPVYGMGEYEDGRPYYAMRFIRGESLKEAIDRFHTPSGAHKGDASGTQLEFRRLLGRFVAACNAVAYAHSRGVIHRDLKPANIMLGPFEETLVVDWGLAKSMEMPAETVSPVDVLLAPSASGPAPTMAGSALGTPSYMSPEQAAGLLDEIGPRSDVYGLGATLYALLTGRSPFEGRDVHEVLVRVQRGEFTPPRRINPAISPVVNAVCLKAMATRPEDRYRSPGELADDVESWLADEPVSAYPEPRTVRLGRWSRRHKTIVVGSAALLLTAVVALAIGTALLEGSRRSEREQRRLAELARQESAERANAEASARRQEEEQRRQATAARERSEDHYYLSTIALAGREWFGNNAARVGDLLNAAPPGRRNWEWHYLKRQGASSLRTLAGQHVGAISGLAFSPDGTRLVSVGLHGTILVWDSESGQVHLSLGGVLGHRGRVAGVCYSPDGRRIASVGDDGTVRLWDATSGKIHKAFMGHEGGALSVAFSPDGGLLVTGGRDGLVRIWDGDSGIERRTLRGHTSGVSSVAFSRDGRLIASGSLIPDGSVRIWEVGKFESVRVYPGHSAGVNAVTFRPDGLRLASAGEDGAVRIWDVERGGLLDSLVAHGRPVRAAAYSSDGTSLATVGLDQCVRLWDARSGLPLSTRRGHSAGLACLAFRPDGKQLATAGEDVEIKVWNPTGEQESVHLKLQGTSVASAGPAFRDDGRLLASAHGNLIDLCDPIAATTHPPLRGHSEDVEAVAFHPKARQLASVDSGGTVKIWDIESTKELRSLAGPAPAKTGEASWRRGVLAYRDGGNYLIYASMGGEVKVWHANNGREVRTYRVRRPPKAFGLNGSDTLTALEFNRDGSRLAVGDMGGTVRIYDSADGHEVAVFDGEFAFIGGLAFSRDGTRLASAGSHTLASSSEIRIRDLTGRRPLLSFSGPTGMTVSLAFNLDGSRLAAVGFGDDPRLYDTGTGWEVLNLPPGSGTREPVSGLEFSPDGTRLVSSGGDGLRIWVATPGREIFAFRRVEMVMGLAYSPDGSRLASSAGKAIFIQDAQTGRDLMTLTGPEGSASTIWSSLAFSPDGETLVAGEITGRIALWNATTGRLGAVLEGHKQVVMGLAFSPNGRLMASASHDGTAKLWDITSRAPIQTLRSHTDRVNGIAFSPDGRRLLTCSRDRTLKEWDVASGQELRSLKGHEGSISSAVYSPDGRLIASAGGRNRKSDGSTPGQVKIWESATGRALVSISDLDRFVLGVAFTPDGRTITTVSDDPIVRLWDAGTGQLRLSLSSHTSFVTRVSLHPNGRWIASGGNDRYVRVWNLENVADANPNSF